MTFPSIDTSEVAEVGNGFAVQADHLASDLVEAAFTHDFAQSDN